MHVPASQQTPPRQLPASHATLHAVPVQLTRLQVVIPLQVTFVFLDLLETSSAQARAPEHSTAHVFPVQVIDFVHESGFLHAMSHDPASQMIAPVQVPAAVHPTRHELPLHAIPLVHAPAPLQLMTHALAAVQSIGKVHAPAPKQFTAQGMPAGQTMAPVQEPAATQSTAQVPASLHEPTPASAQMDGHTPAASIVQVSGAASPASLASGMTLVSGSFASVTVASSSTVPASLTADPSPPRRRPQPAATSGRTRKIKRTRFS